jgi:hypothetical protein
MTKIIEDWEVKYDKLKIENIRLKEAKGPR